MLALCREHRLEHRTKHIALRYFLARELQQRGQLRLAYVASEANTADIFTKALAPGDHQRFCTLLAHQRAPLPSAPVFTPAQRPRAPYCPALSHAPLPGTRTRPAALRPCTPCCPACPVRALLPACPARLAALSTFPTLQLLLSCYCRSPRACLALPSAIALPCPATPRLARASAPRVAARPCCTPLVHAALQAPLPCRTARDLPCLTACALPTHCHRTVCQLPTLLALNCFARCTAHAALPCRELQPAAAATLTAAAASATAAAPRHCCCLSCCPASPPLSGAAAACATAALPVRPVLPLCHPAAPWSLRCPAACYSHKRLECA
ncbi:unnamed protein product [Closterium sp. NIES-54]